MQIIGYKSAVAGLANRKTKLTCGKILQKSIQK